MRERFRLKKCVLVFVAMVLFVAGSVGATSVTWYRDAFSHDAWHSVGSGWSYYYVTSTATGYWKDGTYGRLAYSYGTGQWWHCSSAWATLGGTGGPTEFIGDGNPYALAGGWYYLYVAACDTAYWRDGSAWRLAYGYIPQQWWHARNVWTKLGATKIGPGFIGNGAYWTVGGGWQYAYASGCDTGYWKNSSNHQFAYSYNPGLWWDYIGSTWGRLGLDGQLEQFIADGQNRPITSSEGTDYFRYGGSYYYWRAGSIDYYRYEYSTGKWYEWLGSSWSAMYTSYYDVDVRHIGGHSYVERYRRPDPGLYAPTGYYDIIHNVWQVSTSSYDWASLGGWTIHRPGADNKWSGGRLNVMWCHSADHNRGFAEYPLEDTIIFKYEMDVYTLQWMVDHLSRVRDYYRTQISTVVFNAHGNEYGWNIGQWIDSRSGYSGYYGNYQAIFQQWGQYMTTDGQIISYHCSTGVASAMLNQIAVWTTCDIFAHNHTVYVYGSPYQSSYSTGDSSIWNYNWWDMYMGGAASFEYKSNPSATARIILSDVGGW